jgi:hypothetical protein
MVYDGTKSGLNDNISGPEVSLAGHQHTSTISRLRYVHERHGHRGKVPKCCSS